MYHAGMRAITLSQNVFFTSEREETFCFVYHYTRLPHGEELLWQHKVSVDPCVEVYL